MPRHYDPQAFYEWYDRYTEFMANEERSSGEGRAVKRPSTQERYEQKPAHLKRCKLKTWQGRTAKQVLDECHYLGAYLFHSAVQGSHYVKFEDPRIGSLRIADHGSRDKYAYRWEIRSDIATFKITQRHGFDCFHYPATESGVLSCLADISKYNLAIQANEQKAESNRDLAIACITELKELLEVDDTTNNHNRNRFPNQKIKRCMESLKKYHGLAPFNNPENTCRGDAKFLSMINNNFDSAVQAEARERLGIQ